MQVKDKGATSKPRLLSPGPETRRDSDEQATPPLSRTKLNGHDRTGTRTWTRRPQGANENEQATPPLSRARLNGHDSAREPGRGQGLVSRVSLDEGYERTSKEFLRQDPDRAIKAITP